MMMRRAGKRHLLTKKSTRRKRGYAVPIEANKSELQGIRRLLPYL